MKNGYTTNAGNTFTGVAERDGHVLLVTVMHPEPGHLKVYKEAATLLDWGFKADGKVKPVGDLAPPDQPRPARTAGRARVPRSREAGTPAGPPTPR